MSIKRWLRHWKLRKARAQIRWGIEYIQDRYGQEDS